MSLRSADKIIKYIIRLNTQVIDLIIGSQNLCFEGSQPPVIANNLTCQLIGFCWINSVTTIMTSLAARENTQGSNALSRFLGMREFEVYVSCQTTL